MGKVILICGKLCSGKTYYAKQLKEKNNAVILSTDEMTYDLIDNKQGEFYDIFAEKANLYLRKKAVEIAQAGANVILDWGFWTRKSRIEMSEFLKWHNVPYEWHYIDIRDDLRKKNIEERNKSIAEGEGGSDFFVDEGLLRKMSSMFEVPENNEVDVWYVLER